MRWFEAPKHLQAYECECGVGIERIPLIKLYEFAQEKLPTFFEA